jgi:soluble lytic murein transglycosylase-like protein
MTPESTHSLDLMRNQLGFKTLSSMQHAAKGMNEASTASAATGPNAKETSATGISEADKKRWKASLEFEAMFMSQMYKAMRQTVASEGNELTEASPGREIFTEMLDNQYAGLHAKSKLETSDQGLHNAMTGASNGMAAQIYRAMCRKEGASLPMPFIPGRNSIPMAPVAVSKLAAMTEETLKPMVDLASKTYGIDTSLIKSVIHAESANRPHAVSKAGAKGLMQLMDSTASDLGVQDVFNAKENILAGTKYLRQLLNRFGGSEEKALAAYNAGPGVVERYGGIPPYQETQDYVKKVLKKKNALEAESLP